MFYDSVLTLPGVLMLEGILEPTKGATTIPDFIVERFSECVANYALYEMMSMPGVAWSDINLSARFRRKYEARLAEAKVAKARKGTTGRIRVPNHPF